MAHFALLWKARTIEKYRQNYENEKINSIIMSNADIPDKTLFQRWRHYSHGMQKRLSRKFSKWYPEGTTVSNFFVSLRTDMKLPSILLRSLSGFIGGLLLTYLGFMFFVFQLSLSLMHATVLSSVLGVLLTLGLTFSNRMRCLIFLLVPQLFSRVGRYTLTCYALVLILTGPATNTLKNSEVLSESMACSQEQIKLNVKHINDSIKKPFNSIKDSLKITIESMKLIVRNLKIAIIRINRLILSIASVIQSGFSWLGYIVNVCNKALGTPLEKCHNAIKEDSQKIYEQVHKMNTRDMKSYKDSLRNFFGMIPAKHLKESKNKDNTETENIMFHNSNKITKDVDFKSCKEKGDKNPWFCNKDNVANAACASLKPYKKFCEASDFVEETILATIKKKLRTFTYRISTLLRLKLNIRHTYTFISNSSSTNQIAAGIVTEIRNRADPILTWLSWSSCVTSLFILLIIFRAKHYQHMFETRSPFDNRFITKEFRKLDLKRLRVGRETVLPLNRRERAKYVTTTSFRLVASEKVHLNRSAVFMTVTTFKLLIHIVADYSLYWVLMTIRHHGKLQTPLKPGKADTGVFISGSGFVARLLQSFIDSLNLQLIIPPSDDSCLPNPYPPDFKRYSQIGFLIFLLWFFALLEPYGLRLRHHIMGHYRPKRAKTRALWLYNHILRTRASFMKFARRRLHREYKYSSQSTMTFRQWLRTHIPFNWLKLLLGIKPKLPHCLLCNTEEEPNDSGLIKCEVPNCPGTYCTSCFSDIGQLCTICLSPSDYGDLSDVSLEKGSSDEDESDDDYNLGGNNATAANRRHLEGGTNTYENDIEEATSEGCTFGRRKRFSSIREKNDRKDCETFPLLQQKCPVFNVNNHKWPSSDIINRKLTANIKEYQIILVEKYLFVKEKHERDISIATCKYLNKDVHSLTTIPTTDLYYQYSVYLIKNNPLVIEKIERTTVIAKYLRRKKLLRRNKKIVTRLKYFMTCSNTNITTMHAEITQVGGNGDQAKDSNNTDKPNNKAKNNLSKANDEAKHNSLNNKAEITDNKGTTTIKRSKVDLKHFHTKFVNFWKNVTLKILPSASLIDTRRDLPPVNEKKHKRKKKHKKGNKNHAGKASQHTKLKNSNTMGYSRLFAYLDERDWVQNSLENTKPANNAKELSKEKPTVDDEENNMLVNNIIIPRLNLDFEPGSIVELQINNTSICDEATGPEIPNTTARIDFAEGALDRFFKSIASQSCEVFEISSNQIECNERLIKEDETNSLHEKKYMAYPSSSKCKITQDSYKSHEKLREFRLMRVLSGSFSGYKLYKPLSLIKNVYSSLFLHRDEPCENNLKTDEKRTQTKNEKQIKWKDTQSVKRRDEKIQTKKERNDKKKSQKVDIKETESEDEKVCNVIEKARTGEIKDDKQIQTFSCLIETADKRIGVCPLMNSCGFQKDDCKVETHDCAIQKEEEICNRKPISRGYDAEVMTSSPQTCTCAAQCQKSNRNVAVFTDRQKKKVGPVLDPPCTCESCKSNKKINQASTKDCGTEFTKKRTDKLKPLTQPSPACGPCKSKDVIKQTTTKESSPRVAGKQNNKLTPLVHPSCTCEPCFKSKDAMKQAFTNKQTSVAEKQIDIMEPQNHPSCTCKPCKSYNDMNQATTKDCSTRDAGIRTDKLEPLGQHACNCQCVSRDAANQATPKEFRIRVVGRRRDTGRSRNRPCNYCDVKFSPYKIKDQRSDNSDISKEEEICYSNYSSSELFSSKSEESKTDTTVCSLANIDYHKNNRKVNENNRKINENNRKVNEKVGRYKVKVVTKANQSTLTDKTKQCDVSTTTNDWWSPIVEKKENKVEKKKKDNDMTRKRRLYKSRGVNAGERIVTFRSTAQLIPNRESDFLDIMSPSRYLLESQKYYNELFHTKLVSPRVFPVVNVQQRNSNSEKERSQISSRHHNRRVRKTKRLEESYLPMKQVTPRKRGVEFVRSPEASRSRRRIRRRN